MSDAVGRAGQGAAGTAVTTAPAGAGYGGRSAAVMAGDAALLRERLAEAEETLRAIRLGDVDALVVQGPDGPRTYTLVTADQSYRMLVEQMREGALTLAPDGLILYANPRFAELAGRDLLSVPGQPLDALVRAADRGVLRALIATAPGASDSITVELEQPDGGSVPVQISMSVLESHGFRGFCAIVTDLSEQLRRAQEVSDERMQLEAERALRTAAEQANRTKGDFLAAMSHELRTPLNAIGGYVDLLLSGARGVLVEEQVSDLGRVRRASVHLLGLINDLLNFAKLEAGHLEYAMGTQPLAEVVSTGTALVERQAATKGLHFDRGEAAPELMVYGDPEKILQILLNLLSNAVKFTPAGGTISVTCGRDADGAIRIDVRDTGRGIAGDQLARIFDPFVQVGRHRFDANTGVGLGLAISRELARGMGGDLTAESDEGSGSLFSIHLQSAPPQRPAE